MLLAAWEGGKYLEAVDLMAGVITAEILCNEEQLTALTRAMVRPQSAVRISEAGSCIAAHILWGSPVALAQLKSIKVYCLCTRLGTQGLYLLICLHSYSCTWQGSSEWHELCCCRLPSCCAMMSLKACRRHSTG